MKVLLRAVRLQSKSLRVAMNKLTILGAGGHGKIVGEIAGLAGYTDVSFADAKWPSINQIGPWNVCSDLKHAIKGDIFCAIGNNAARSQVTSQYIQNKFPILLHPNSVVSAYTEIEAGTVVMAGAVINPYVKIGRSVIINTSCSVDHDCQIGDFAHISPGAHLAGSVVVGKRAWVGIGAIVKEGISIGEDAIIGAGAVAIRDVAIGEIVVGNPAKTKDKNVKY